MKIFSLVLSVAFASSVSLTFASPEGEDEIKAHVGCKAINNGGSGVETILVEGSCSQNSSQHVAVSDGVRESQELNPPPPMSVSQIQIAITTREQAEGFLRLLDQPNQHTLLLRDGGGETDNISVDNGSQSVLFLLRESRQQNNIEHIKELIKEFSDGDIEFARRSITKVSTKTGEYKSLTLTVGGDSNDQQVVGRLEQGGSNDESGKSEEELRIFENMTKVSTETGEYKSLTVTVGGDFYSQQAEGTLEQGVSNESGKSEVALRLFKQTMANAEDHYCDVQKSKKHADCMIRTLGLIAPDTDIFIFLPTELNEVRAHPARIVGMSSFAVARQALVEDQVAGITDFCTLFRDSGKLIVLALGNEGERVTSTHPFFQYAQNADGFSVILAAGTSSIDDRLLGDELDYVSRDDEADFSPHLITAPGFYLTHLPDGPHFGTSYASPLIVAAASILLSENPDLRHDELKDLLISSGRKPEAFADNDEEKRDCVRQFEHIFGSSTEELNYDDVVLNLKEMLKMRDLDTYRQIIQDPTLRRHAWGDDRFKYSNHLDIDSALELLRERT